MEDVRLRKSELCSARPEVRAIESESVLNIEFFSARLPLRLSELVGDRNRAFLWDELEVIANEPVGARVQEVAVPA